MVICRLCSNEYHVLTDKHMKRKHNITLSQYKEQFPDAEIGKPRSNGDPLKKEDTKPYNIAWVEGDGDYRVLRANQSVYLKFREFKEKHKWSVRECILKLIEFWEQNEESESARMIAANIPKSRYGLPEDFIPQHREKLQNMLLILEDMAIKERDPQKLAMLAEKITRINQVLPQLEKSYDTTADLKIQEIVEKRKMICRNHLPELT
jgi:hypothetical protein